jgi:hypothetical protein
MQGKKPSVSESNFSISSPGQDSQEASFEKHFSVAELAELWSLSEQTIRRIFSGEPGVIEWGHNERRFKRGYKTLRIPESIVQRVHGRLRSTG